MYSLQHFLQKVYKKLSCYFPSTGTLNDKVHITNPAPNGSDINEEHTSPPTGINGLFKAVISSPGPIVSFSRLNSKGVFRRHATDDISGKHLMQQVADQLPELELGNVEQFTIPGNKSQVRFTSYYPLGNWIKRCQTH